VFIAKDALSMLQGPENVSVM